MSAAQATQFAELVSRVSTLESDVAWLKRQLTQSQIQLAIRRGREEAQQGRVVPAEELVQQLRTKRGLPTP